MALNILKQITELWNKLTSSTYSVYYLNNGKPNFILEFDTIIESNYRSNSTLTSYPVESGIYVTDYKYNNPDTLHLKGIVSRSSYARVGNISIFSPKSKIENITRDLEIYRTNINDLFIQTKSKLYKGFDLVDYEINENLENYGLFEVDMTFNQLVKLEDKILNASNISDQDIIDIGITTIKRL